MDSIDLPLQARLAPINSVDPATRTANLIWTSGARVRRYDWIHGRHFFEELSLDPKSVRMARLQNGAPVLNSHRSGDLSAVIGVVENAKLENGQGTAKIRFSEREDVQPILRDVQDGILKNVSTGYVIHELEELPADETSEGLPVYRALDWEPYELSLVPIGADVNAKIRFGYDSRLFPCKFRNRIMTIIANPKQAVAAEPVHTRGEAEIELERGLLIRKHVADGGLDTRLADQLIKDRVPLDQAREQILNALAARSNEVNIQGAAALHLATPYGAGGALQGMTEALCVRAGIAKRTPAAEPYLHMRLSDMAAVCLENAGEPMRGQAPDRILKRAIYHTTSDFPNLLLGTGDRALRLGYESFSGGLIRIGKPSTARDFRAKHKLMLSEAPKLEEVLEGGEVRHGTMTESKESYSLVTYARIFGLTRQAMVNDDLSAWVDMLGKFGQSGAELIAGKLVTLLQSNPVMSDGVALFHATHGNLAESGGGIDLTTLGAARKAMRLQKGLDGVTPINAMPKFLVVPAGIETVAEQYLTQIAATQSTQVNPFGGKLELVVDPRLDAGDVDGWYLAADPAVIDGIEYSYLDGSDGPVFATKEGWEVDGMEFKCTLDFGAGVLDHRGLYRNPGPA